MKFRMVDRIVEWRARERIRGVKAVSFEEYCVRSPLGFDERLPESLVLESIFQKRSWEPLSAHGPPFMASGPLFSRKSIYSSM